MEQLEQVAKLERTWNLALVLQIVPMISEKYSPCLYLSINDVWRVNELWFKRYIQKCTLSHIRILNKSWDGKKYNILNILRTEHNFSKF